MQCKDYQELFAALLDESLTEAQRADLQVHVAQCAECQKDWRHAQDMHAQLQRSGRSASAAGPTSVANAVMQRIQSQAPALNQNHTLPATRVAGGKQHRSDWRRIMKKTIPWGAGIAALVAVVILANWPASTSTASAQTILTEGAKATEDMPAMRVTARMRTLPADNFTLIGTDFDFVPVTFTRRGSGQQIEWRLEKPGRVVLVGPKASYMLIKPEGPALKAAGPAFEDGTSIFSLTNLNALAEYEKHLADDGTSTLTVTQENRDGRKLLLVTIEAKAQGDFKNDWAYNKSIAESNNRRVYCFDSENKRLISLQIWLYPKHSDQAGHEVLVFETTKIEYPTHLEDQEFALALPDGVKWQDISTWQTTTAPTPDAATYHGPQEIAKAFLEAVSAGDGKKMQELYGIKMPQLEKFAEEVRSGKLQVKVLAIGEPFKSGLYPGWFVPYEMEFSAGERKETKKHNLAVRNDNPAKRWYVDGGF